MKYLAALLVLLLGVAEAVPAATPTVVGGGNHTLALGADGRVRAWGQDSSGQLGNGRTLAFTSPLPVPALAGVRALSSGQGHTLGLRADGTVVAVGDGLFGAIGDGTNTSRVTPVVVPGLTGVTAVEAGQYFSMALRNDGTVWSWGYNTDGQLGDGTTNEHNSPARIAALSGITAIAAGDAHALAVRADGTVAAWGDNEGGQLGDATTIRRTAPVTVAGLSNVMSVSAGDEHSLALKRDGTVWAWGANSHGQLGNGTTTGSTVPVAVSGLANIVAVSAGGGFSLALRGDGTVWAWGYNLFDQLGDNGVTFLSSSVPVRVFGLTNITAISANYAHSIARRGDGAVFTWGQNLFGQLGDGTTAERIAPVQVPGVSGAVAVSTGIYNTHAILADGRVFAWGSNSTGQLGAGLAVFRTVPEVVPGLTDIVAISAGFESSFAVRSDGRLFAWGGNGTGQLGDGTLTNRSTPVMLAGIDGVVAVSAGFDHTLALKSDGTVRAWGDNFSGAAGHGNPAFGAFIPGPVPGITQAVAVSAGFLHSLVLKADGTVLAFGFNGYGQLGDGTLTSRSTPAPVTGLTNVAGISAGLYHSLAVRRDGTVAGWGSNAAGQLGDGTFVDRRLPVTAVGLSDATAVFAGSGYSLALRRDATLAAWGDNFYGALGDGGSGFNYAFARPVAGLTQVRAASAGYTHALAMRADGSVLGFGYNIDGEIGDGTTANRPRPVVTRRESGAGSIAGNDWFLDLDPAVASSIPADKVPVFLVVAAPVALDLQANVQFRAQDVGTTGSIYVFALAPANQVVAAKGGEPPLTIGYAKEGGKDTPVQCVLAQLTASGQLQAVSVSNLQAFVTGVLTAQGQAVVVINGAATATIGGATFFVGYGPNAATMLNNGTNRGVATVPGTRECKPQAPQTGWWWNTAEGGRGYSIEVSGNHIFYAAFLYDDTGRASWLVATGNTSLDGSLYMGPLYRVTGGQSLGGAYRAPNPVQDIGPITLAFSNATNGTMIWPGGTVPIERFNIVPGGLDAPPRAGQPESGWWWNPAESGRGFFMEWQNGAADIAGYMYDDAGQPVWYLSLYPVPDIGTYTGNWWLYANGQALTAPYRPATRINDNFAPVTIQFTSATTAVMTLPNGRTTNLIRHRF